MKRFRGADSRRIARRRDGFALAPLLLATFLSTGLAHADDRPLAPEAFDDAAGYTLRLGADAASQGMLEADLRTARAAFLPKISLGAEWVLAGSANYHPGSVVRNDPTSYPDRDPSLIGVEASLTVFDGAKRLNTLRVATALASAGREASLDLRQQLYLEAASVTLAVIRDRAVVASLREAVRRQRRTLQVTREMLVEENVTLTDIALAAARADEAQAALSGALGTLDVSEAAYRKLIGRMPARRIVFGSPSARLPKSVAEAVVRAEAGAPAPRAAREIAHAARFAVDAARSSFFPTVELVGRASATFDPSPIVDQADTYSALLRLRMPIFDPTLRPALDRAASEASQRRYEADTARLEAASAARTGFAIRQATVAEAGDLSRRVGHARDAVRGMEIERELGTRTIDDVLVAQSRLAEAEVALAMLAYDRDRSAFALLAAMGELTEDDVPSPAVVTAILMGQ